MRPAALLPLLLVLLVGCRTPAQRLAEAMEEIAGGNMGAGTTRLLVLAEEGMASAQFRLALLHLRGTPTPSRMRRARHWLSRAARQGHVGGRYYLGRLLLARDFPHRSPEAGLDWLRGLADAGYAPAAWSLGRIFEQGRAGPARPRRAVRWYRKAAAAGHPQATRRLVRAHRAGELGLPRDPERAMAWRRQLGYEPFSR